uniref:V-SNARE coiled-coil homology domain-containing protein n=1 Tax=Chromera velia CCMP2878 TaxID=1169474 RepID=A0A0G4F9L3_9ALVE|mmetsp:Transcript_19555/g.39371  ORF Transcript_19555/g.39371 Transcript_19555/m.39371 type:complete len:227 (+) Transcript_19555:195-875(+)|eukprot:Cvel_184.t1-p1 / transcript=Cvel_184.t1 / gene=Cvel_184 / organism=Chromera_velia_CCMP2878 / gene_product=Vesicle-associated membrane protein 7B, putative / transcript_product=Vesicle-associated membrane protein 7B, putative / location=Cvel_scaffold11:105980-109820(-) / protein_length=226 / sequence_SO=supercontig / SO=protein_coding / is_pseudo=false
MTITHALVVKGAVVLCEYTDSDDGLLEIAWRMTSKISGKEGKRRYMYDNRTFNCLTDGDLHYICIADAESGADGSFSFLEELKRRFKVAYDRQPTGGRGESRQEALTKVLKSCMEKFGGRSGHSSLERVETELEGVTELVRSNIGKVMQRGEMIDSLVEKTDLLKHSAGAFRYSARGLKRNMWWQQVKAYLVLTAVLLGAVFVVVSIACGGPTLSPFTCGRSWTTR